MSSGLSFSLRDERCSDLQIELGHVKTQMGELRSQLTRAQDEHQVAQQHLRLYRDQVHRQTDGLFHDLRALLEENFQLRNDMSSGSGTAEKLQDALASMRDENRKLQQQRDDADTQVSVLKQSQQELLSRWESAASKFEDVPHRVADQLSSMRDSVERLRAERDVAQQQLQAGLAQRSGLSQDNHRMAIALQAMQREMDRAREVHTEEATALRREIDALGRKLAVASAQQDGTSQRLQAEVRATVPAVAAAAVTDRGDACPD
jgi:chromosome segregation ATPase